MRTDHVILRFRQVAGHAGFFLCLSAIGLFAFGCASTSGGAKANIGSQHQTFAVSMLSPYGTPFEQATVKQMAPVAVDAVSTALTGKGYREASLENADMVVQLSGKFAPDFKAQVSQTTGAITPTVAPESAQHRVLAITVIDNSTKKTLWADSRTASGDATPPPDRLRAVIAEMLAPFPSATQ